MTEAAHLVLGLVAITAIGLAAGVLVAFAMLALERRRNR